MRLIDADALKERHGMGEECSSCVMDTKACQYDRDYSKMDFCEWLDDAPTIDAVPVVHAYWTTKRAWQHDGEIYCSACDHDAPTEGDYRQVKTNYCPNCGAKMDGKEQTDE